MIKIADIKEEFENAKVEELEEVIAKYQFDERSGVKKLIEKARKTQEKLRLERERIEEMREFEHKYQEYEYI